jgi:hypothetical protein
MTRRVRTTALVLVVGLTGIQLMRPDRSNPPEQAADTIQARVPMTPEAAAVFDRSCRDCHSDRTRWPWYSQVAPVSWFVADHVNHARSHLNVSRWSRYSAEDAAEHVEEICEEAREGKMPLPSYLWIHRGAALSDQDIEALCAWSAAARAAMGGVSEEHDEGKDHREAEPHSH